jgi:hypothetical protein
MIASAVGKRINLMWCRFAAASTSVVVAVLLLQLFAFHTVHGALDDVLLSGSFHGHIFGPEYGWVFAKIEFTDTGRSRLATRIAVSKAAYNLTCLTEEYSLSPVTDAKASVEGVVPVAVELPNVRHRRGCLFFRQKDGDFSELSIFANVEERQLTAAAKARNPTQRLVTPASLSIRIRGLASNAGVPDPVEMTLEASHRAERSEHDLSQHFPPHKRRTMAPGDFHFERPIVDEDL